MWRVVNLRPLGEGGCGDLYIGNRSDDGATVVVKFLREHHDAANRRYFAREVRILGRRFKGMIPILAAHLEASPPYYVMPYFERGTLAILAGQFSQGDIWTIATELATSLEQLHRARIVHGDVKPDNILLDRNGELNVGDPLGNGSGCTLGFTANRGGTPGYWAPEIAGGRPMSYAGDVYSFGATLFHIITGTRPKDGQRLDVRDYGIHWLPNIRDLVLACTEQKASLRPTMSEVRRVMDGESLAEILKARAEPPAFLKGILAFTAACAALGVVATTLNEKGTR